MTRSLLSGSEKSLSATSDSTGGSCGTAPKSKPYMMRSAADAASAAIDYSKGDVEDGVVDSPPSRGPVRTPICSPSPLKRASSSRGRSFSPTPRTEGATNRKLDLPIDRATEHPGGDDATPKSAPQPMVEVNAIPQRHQGKRAQCDSSIAGQLPRLEDKRPRPSQYAGEKRSPSADSLFRQTILRDQRRSSDSKSTGFGQPYINFVNTPLPKPPPRGCKSLSNSEVPPNTRKTKRMDRGSLSLSLCNAVHSESGPHYPSRREDIFKGLAKLKALELARTNSTTNTDG
jgi:hypothetical protein